MSIAMPMACQGCHVFDVWISRTSSDR